MIGWLFFAVKISNKIALIVFSIGAFCLLSTLFIFNKVSIDHFVLYGIPSALMVVGGVYANQIKASSLTKIGDALYSIYLLQAFAIPFFYKLLAKFDMPHGVFNDLFALLCLFFSTILGLIFYLLVESRVSVFLKANIKRA